jgi:hypothetical protein
LIDPASKAGKRRPLAAFSFRETLKNLPEIVHDRT